MQTKAFSVGLASTKIKDLTSNVNHFQMQNNDSADNVFVHFGEGPATIANGWKLGPGEAMKVSGELINNEIYAITDGAAASDTIVLWDREE